jgi:DNA polymerase-3 subunit delta
MRSEELAARLAKSLAPLYVVHGDEPLLALEAGDAIRAKARASGIEDREVLVVEQGFRWDAFLAVNATLGLFGGRRVVDLRIPTGKPGAEGAKALEAYAANPNPDNVTLVTLPKLDRAAQSSAWFSALCAAAVVVEVKPVERDALPRWIGERLARQKQAASPQTLAFLAELCEGNLLAARQEIEKLALLLPEGALEHEAVESAIADVARYDVQAASEAWLGGDAARALRVLSVLEAEGEAVTLAVWQMGEDLHALASVMAQARDGVPLAAAIRNARVWGRRQAALERAVRRVQAAQIPSWLQAIARLDALAKGLGAGKPWDELAALALAVCGKPARPLAFG